MGTFAIGRLGGLATALGIGLAVAVSGAGQALAAPADSAGADSGRGAATSSARQAAATTPGGRGSSAQRSAVAAAKPENAPGARPPLTPPATPATPPVVLPPADPGTPSGDAKSAPTSGTQTTTQTSGATSSVVTPTVTFAFNYLDSSWSADAKSALESTATSLASRFTVTSPVTLTLNVAGMNNRGSTTLAYSSANFSGTGAGFYGTVIQTKILTGTDSNGTAADATITYNFAYPWALGDSVGSGQYDFQAVALHELLHAFGFLTGTGGNPKNTDRNWTTYDRFLSTSNGTRVIDTNYNLIRSYTDNFTGKSGGLYFAGPNAVAANGGPVKLYTPNPWQTGSSVSHLDPKSGYVMNPWYASGVVGPRVLSPVEVAIMKDLYTKTDGTTVFAFLLVAFRITRRTRR